jgi:hypothetical protein
LADLEALEWCRVPPRDAQLVCIASKMQWRLRAVAAPPPRLVETCFGCLVYFVPNEVVLSSPPDCCNILSLRAAHLYLELSSLHYRHAWDMW